jgi:hypothetical protein
MMIRHSTQHGESMQKHVEIACTRCTKTISMLNKEEMGVAIGGENFRHREGGVCSS